MSADDGLPNLIRLDVGALPDVRLFRNSVGGFRTEGGGWIQTGLCEGSSDLIGPRSMIITPSMVGCKVAVFSAIETKKVGARTKKERLIKQTDFIEMIKAMGGFAGFAHSVEEARRILRL